jgi:starch synthase
MNIIFISPECSPFAKASGLGDLVSYLAKSIEREGHNVKVIIPRYGSIDPSSSFIEKLPTDINIDFNGKETKTMVFKGIIPDSLVSIFFTESQSHFSNSKDIYLDSIFSDDAVERNNFFCKSTLEVISNLGFTPDIIHIFGYQFSSLCKLLKNNESIKSKIVFTIYNTSDLSSSLSYIKNTKDAIKLSDLTTTVSNNYAKELLTHNNLGLLLKEKKDCFKGVFSGIDNEIYDPEKDKEIAQTFAQNYFSAGKKKCRDGLFELCDFEQSLTTPLFGMVTRLSEDKGFHLLLNSLPLFSTMNLELILLAKGPASLEQELVKVASKISNVKVFIDFNSSFAKKIYAGSDFFLSVSKTNSGGASILTSMKYGSVPIAYSSGVNSEIITDIEEKENANGLLYTAHTRDNLILAISKAIKYFKNKDGWTKLVKESMSSDSSRVKPEEEYLKCYEDILLQKIVND